MKVDGACHCGHITYRAEILPEKVMVCHCTDCQTLSGSAYRTVAPVVDGSFELLSGALRTYIKTAESGRKRAQSFCPECGSPIYAASDDDPPVKIGLRVGTIRQRDELRPVLQAWSRSAQSWTGDLDAIRKIDSQ